MSKRSEQRRTKAYQSSVLLIHIDVTHDSNFSIRGKKKSSHTLPYNCFNIGRSGKKIKEG